MSYNQPFNSLVKCTGYILEEHPDKIKFQQEYDICWIRRKYIDSIHKIQKTGEGWWYCDVFVMQSEADSRQLQGELA